MRIRDNLNEAIRLLKAHEKAWVGFGTGGGAYLIQMRDGYVARCETIEEMEKALKGERQ